MLIGTPFVAYSLGVLYVYSLGGCLPWRSVAHLSTLLPSLALLALCFSPESPTWLARRGRFHDASAAMARLRGDPDIVSSYIYRSSFWSYLRFFSLPAPTRRKLPHLADIFFKAIGTWDRKPLSKVCQIIYT